MRGVTAPIALTLLGVIAGLSSTGALHADGSKRPLGLDLYRPVPDGNPLTPAKVDLGRRLFRDRRLSRDGSMACASCHDPGRAFTNGEKVARALPARGTRNVPTIVNRVWRRSFFWDGRAYVGGPGPAADSPSRRAGPDRRSSRGARAIGSVSGAIRRRLRPVSGVSDWSKASRQATEGPSGDRGPWGAPCAKRLVCGACRNRQPHGGYGKAGPILYCRPMNPLLVDSARHQSWADAELWRALEQCEPATNDQAIRNRLHHLHLVQRIFLRLASGKNADTFEMSTPQDFPTLKALREFGERSSRDFAALLEAMPDQRLTERLELPWFQRDPPFSRLPSPRR